MTAKTNPAAALASREAALADNLHKIADALDAVGTGPLPDALARLEAAKAAALARLGDAKAYAASMVAEVLEAFAFAPEFDVEDEVIVVPVAEALAIPYAGEDDPAPEPGADAGDDEILEPAFSPAELRDLAERFPPPQEWYDETPMPPPEPTGDIGDKMLASVNLAQCPKCKVEVSVTDGRIDPHKRGRGKKECPGSGSEVAA